MFSHINDIWQICKDGVDRNEILPLAAAIAALAVSFSAVKNSRKKK